MSEPAPQTDCLIIGGGHNGLVCAATLAKAGRKVLLVEAAERPGGAAITREFAPGFRVSAGAHLLHLMPAALIRELGLEAAGLEWAARGMPTTALGDAAAPVTLHGGRAEGVSSADAQAFARYDARMRRFAAAIAPLLSRTPPRLGTEAWADRWGLLKMGWEIRRLGRRDMREILRIGGMNAFDLLQEHFDSPVLKGALGFDAVLGANFGPRSPGTVLTLLYRLAAEHAAGDAGLCQPKGGMGAVAAALVKVAEHAGAVLRTGAVVKRILVENDRAVGVELESGEALRARSVISSADPKTTFLSLLGTRHLDTNFVRRVRHLRTQGLAAKLHLALESLPRFANVTERGLRGRLLLAPSLEHVEHAFNHSKYGEFSAAPALEITLPSVNDPSLAPPGRHVLSAVVQYVPHALKSGWNDESRARLKDVVIGSLERHAPGLAASIVATELSTPADLEREFRTTGGHWHHADLAFDQFLFVRPVPGAAQYRTPLDGLYLCGAGCHPGGGVMGVAGRNAAHEVLKS